MNDQDFKQAWITRFMENMDCPCVKWATFKYEQAVRLNLALDLNF